MDARDGLEGERKQVTVLFADIQGSTRLIEGMDPEQAVRLMQPTLQHMMDAVHRYEGTVNRVQGDGIMALFGAPVAHEDHAVRACHAAVAIQASLPGSENLPVRVGINTGEVVVHSIRNDLTIEYEADGPTVHLAARMEQMAEPGTILLTGDTYRLAQGLVMVDSLGPKPVKGMSRDIPVFALRGVRSGRTRVEARVTGMASPFVGRESEIAALERALARSADHRGQVVAVSGDAGVGKSRLIREFIARAQDGGWTVRITGCDPLAVGVSYQPVVDLLKSLFDIDDGDTPAQVAAKVRDAVLALDASLEAILPALLSILDAPVDDPGWGRLNPQERRRRIIDATRTLTLTRAAALPLLMVFEDLHWADAQSQAVLDALVDGLAGSRMMLLVSYRPEHVDPWATRRHYTRLRVDPLGALTAEEFLSRTLGRDPGLDGLKALLVERTQGVPFFLEESIRALVETGQLRGDPGAYRMAAEVEELEVPASVQMVLAARIDRLQPRSKEVLQVASVIGQQFPLPVLAGLTSMAAPALDAILAELQKAEFVYLTETVPEQVYAFQHALTRDVAYASLLRGTRRAIHERLVTVIETHHAARIDEHLAVLGRHAFTAELWEPAQSYLERAAERAIERYAYQDAVKLLEQRLDALDRLPEDLSRSRRMFDVHLQLRSAHGATGDVAKMVEHLRVARSMAGSTDDERRGALVEVLAASVIDLYEDPEAMTASIVRAGATSRVAADPVLPWTSSLAASILATYAGHYQEAIDMTGAAFEEDGDRFRLERFGMTGTWTVQILAVNAIARALRGDFGAARCAAADAVRIAGESGHPFDEGIAQWTLGAVGIWSGDRSGSVTALRRGFEACESRAVGILIPSLAPTLAYALCLEGHEDEAREAFARRQASGHDGFAFWFHGWAAAFEGLAAHLLGEPQVARAALGRWKQLVARHGLRGIEAAVVRADAVVRHAAGDGARESIVADLSAAFEVSEALGAAPDAAHCLLAMAAVGDDGLSPDRRRGHLTEASRRFRELGMVYWEREAQRRLARLAAE